LLPLINHKGTEEVLRGKKEKGRRKSSEVIHHQGTKALRKSLEVIHHQGTKALRKKKEGRRMKEFPNPQSPITHHPLAISH